MKKRNKLLIIDNNLDFIISLYKCIECKNVNYNVFYKLLELKEVIDYIKVTTPDIVFLNLDQINYNKKEVLHQLSKLNIKIFLIVNEIVFINSISLLEFKNICKIYVKPLNWSEINKDLKYLDIQDNQFRITNLILQNDTDKLKNIVIQEISIFNFNKSSIGYKYLIVSIIEILKDVKKLENIEKNLLHTIASQLNIDNPKKIKWSLQKTIDSMVRYTDDNLINKYFPYTNKPTTKMFLATINSIIIKKYK